jgi:hypothetical protein
MTRLRLTLTEKMMALTEDTRDTIAEVIMQSNYFPSFVNDEDNQALKKEVGKEELYQTLQSFQKGKIPRPNGLLVEYFLGYYDFKKEDLRRVVETMRT